MATPIVNFGLVTVSGTYNGSATSITLQTGDGSRLPDTDGGYRYPLIWWDAATYAHPADDPNREIVLVTNRATDTLTVVRGQEGTSASTKNDVDGTYRMSLSLTAALHDELRVARSTHQGLVLQTARHSVDAKRVVEITACDSLVMDDGSVLRNDNHEWTGKYADITVSGAGGLDTGAEQAVQWYEVHAIAKEDGARSLILHQSKVWRTDTFNTSGADTMQAIRSATSNQLVSQGFQLFDSDKIVAVSVDLKKTGSPTGVLQAQIYSNSAGVPGVVQASSHYVDVARIPSTTTPVVFTFPHTSPVLSGSTQYHFVLSGNWSVSGVNYVECSMDGSAGTYAEGAKALWNGSAWTADADDDLIFTMYVEHGSTQVTLPAGYTRQCFLGWVYNDDDSDFVPFVQHGRTRRTAALSLDNSHVATLNGSVQYRNLHPFVPPLEMGSVLMGVGGTGTQAAVAAVGDVRATDISSAGDTVAAQVVLYSGLTSTKPAGFTEVMVERGHVMLHGTNGAKVWVAGFSW